MARALQFIAGILVLISIEILAVYFIMPFPGSQESETISVAYFLHRNILYFRIIGVLLILFPAIYYFRFGKIATKIFVGLGIAVWLVIFYFFNFEFAADRMFYQPENKIFVHADKNIIPGHNLIIGVTVNGAAKAYPIELIGYHHQVRDTIGGEAVMITYCTVCRTGRVYSPIVEGRTEDFRLVGMDHFNAMFEDGTTGTWWRQVNGEAIAGPRMGNILAEIPSEQMSLNAWIARHPDTFVMQPDSTFAEAYAWMGKYDEGKSEGDLTRRDSLSWKNKSWIVGVQVEKQSRAYDWNDLVNQRVINDTLGHLSLAVVVESDSASFHVWQTDTLQFAYDPLTNALKDLQTRSHWNWAGVCTEGQLAGSKLPSVQAYQEFWHSWRTFHPSTTTYHVSR